MACDSVARIHGNVVANRPNLVIDENLELDSAFADFVLPNPFVGIRALHEHALVPAQARAAASDKETVAPACIRLNENTRKTACKFLCNGLLWRGDFFNRSLFWRRNFYNFFCKPLTCFECLVRVESINYFWKQLQEIHRKM